MSARNAERSINVVLVTGASSGIGNATATYLAKKGYRVYGTSRNPSRHTKKADEFFELLPMDVRVQASVESAVASIMEKEGRIDALLCCAGMGIAGSIEESSLEEIDLQMDTNFTGTLRCIKAVLPTMRAANKGRIIVLSSIAGLTGMPFQAFYSASKFALEGLVESLRHEIRPFGLEACLVEPGDFRTGFTAARLVASAYSSNSALSPYARLHEAALGVQIRDENAGRPPLELAKLLGSLLEKRRLRIRYTVGPLFQRFAAFAKRLLPGVLFEYFFRKVYRQP